MTSPARLAFLGLLCAALTPRPAAAQCTALEAELPTSPTGYTSPSIDGTRLAVGDPSAGGCQSCGEVDIFEFDGTDWVPTAVIPNPDPLDNDRFGLEVALKGDLLLVSIRGDLRSSALPVYVFLFDGSQWNLQTTLYSPDGTPGDKFGAALAFDGATAIIGAPDGAALLPGGGASGGEAWVFAYDSGLWTQTQNLFPTMGVGCGMNTGGDFGAAIALDGDHAVFGVPLATSNCVGTHGGVSFFERTSGFWYETSFFLEPDDCAYLGDKVALSGDNVLALASDGSGVGCSSGPGHLRPFFYDGTQWTTPGVVPAPAGSADFGLSLSMSGARAVTVSRDSSSVFGVQVLELQGQSWSIVRSFPTSTMFHLGLQGDGRVVTGTAPAAVWQLDAFPLQETGQVWVPVHSASMGNAIASDGDRMVVGAPFDGEAGTSFGAVHVYERSGGAWTRTATLFAGDGATADQFGLSVGVSGDHIVIGAPGDDGAASTDGSVYVFELQGSAWVETQKLIPADRGAGDQVGAAVAISGDRIAFSSPKHDLPLSGCGAVYVYDYDGATWSQSDKLTVSDPVVNHNIGTRWQSVALQGDRLAVGVERDGALSLASAGAVYVFDYDGSDWAETQKVVAAARAYGASVGNSVALDGDRILAGAFVESFGAPSSGGVHVFERNGAFWSETAILQAWDAQVSDWFGTSVALRGSVALVGAPLVDDLAFEGGAAYVYVQNGTEWVSRGKLLPSDGQQGDNYGKAVTLGDDYALIGAPNQDFPNAGGSGSVYTLELDCGSLIGTAAPEVSSAVAAVSGRLQAFPNPVRAGGSTSVRFGLPVGGSYAMELFDVAGRRVQRWDSPRLPAGDVRRELDLRDVMPGVYFLRVEASGVRRAGKVTVLR